MIKKLYLPLVALFVLALSSCSKMGELSADYFSTDPEVLEAVGGKVPVTITGKFPEKYFKKNATVEVTPVLRWDGGEAKGQPAKFQGEKVQGNDQTVSYKAGGTYTMKASFDYVPDPYYMGQDGFELVLDLLEDACKNLFETLAGQVQD